MSLVFRFALILSTLTACLCAQTATVGLSDGDEFVGPFASWTNLKTRYGAAGDGVTDDTAALQSALNDLAVSTRVLYIPAGTYRITAGLTLSTSKQRLSVIGQDPATTIIKWAGSTGGEMLYLNGISYAKFSRLTWDGSSSAYAAMDFGYDGVSGLGGATYDEVSDMVFQNMGFGIRGGSKGFADSEVAILRCKFLGITRAGLSVENPNALDWYVWDSTFTNDNIGVTNIYSQPGAKGGGNFHVFGSLFQSSGSSDIQVGPTSYFGLRQNYSSGSNAFVIAANSGSASAAFSLQSNTILDTITSPIQINNPGPLMMFDNTIRGSAAQSGPLVTVADTDETPNPTGEMIGLGNTVTQTGWYSVPSAGEVIENNTNVVLRSSLNPQPPTMPGALPNYNRQYVFEVAPGSNAAAIQQAIDSAIAFNGQRPVVHLPAGTYSIENTIVIPVGSDLQLVGDGGGVAGPTNLQWRGASSAPVLRLAGPSRATVRDLNVEGSGQSTGILLENVDQPNARVFMEQMGAQELLQTGVLVNGLDNAEVTLHDAYLVSNHTGITVIGGPKAAAGQPVNVRTDIFAGLTGQTDLTYALSNKGRLLSQGVWYEGGQPQFLNFTDSGTFTLDGAHISAQDPAHSGVPNYSVPSVELNSFNGSFTLIGAQLAAFNSIAVQGNGTNTNFLALGIVGPANDSSKPYNLFTNTTSPPGKVGVILSRQNTTLQGASAPLPDQVSSIGPEVPFLNQMLAQTRTEQPHAFSVLPAGVTDARFYRASVSGQVDGSGNSIGGAIGIELDPGGPTSTTAPVISNVGSAVSSSTSVAISWTTDQTADSQVLYGTTTSYGLLSALNTSNVTSHSVSLTNLVPGTLYHFSVRSRSLSGYTSTSPDSTFTTFASVASANFVTSFATGGSAIRNNFSGNLGMQFTVGSAVPTISALGRFSLPGNSGAHTVKLVRASDGGDVPGASVSVNVAGGSGGFVYANLASPVLLSANTSYYLVSQETSGGDSWYDLNAVVSSNLGSVTGAIYQPVGSAFVVSRQGSQSYVPVDFTYTINSSDTTPPSVALTAPASGVTVSGNVTLTATASDNVAVASVQFSVDGANISAPVLSAPYTTAWNTSTVANGVHTLRAVATDTAGNFATSAPITVTVSNSGSPTVGTPLLSSFSATGRIRNDFDGFVGMRFTVGSTALSISSLGRLYVTGNSLTHKVKLVASDGTDVPGGSVTVTPATGAAGQFTYVALASPLTLAANTSYYVLSQEVNGGDQWYDISPVTSTSAAGVDGPAYYFNGYQFVAGSAGQSYVPVNLLYSTTSVTAPVVAITSPSGGATIAGTNVALSATATPASGLTIASVQFSIDGASLGAAVTSTPYTVSLNSTTVTNGTHTLSAVAKDSAGNVGTSSTVSVNVNNANPPTAAITSPASGATISGSSVVVSANAAAYGGATVSTVQFQIDGSNLGAVDTSGPFTTTLNSTLWSNGVHVLTVIVTDSAGNVTTSAAVNVTSSNTIAPTPFILSNSLSVLRNNTTQYVGMEIQIGSTPLQVYALGRIFLNGNLASHPLKLVVGSTGADVPGGSVSVVGGTDKQFTYGQLSNPVTLAANTSYYLVSSETAQGDFWYDQGYVSPTAVGTVLGSVYSSSNGQFTPVRNGSQSFVPVNMLYLAPPAVSITAPAAGSTVSGTSVTLSASAIAAAQRSISSVQFKVDGANVGSAVAVAPFNITLDSTTLTNASHSVTAVAIDSVGNSSVSAAVSFTVNNLPPPTVVITAPAAGATISGTATTISATATPSSGLTIVSLQFKIDGTNVGSAIATAPYTYNLNSTTLTNATHSLTAVATDSAGNTAIATAVSFTVNNTAPTVAITSPAAGATVSGAAVTLTATATATSGRTVSSVQFKVDGVNVGTALTASPYTATIDSTAFSNGTHSLTAVVTDSAGATVTSTALSVTVNNTPTIAITAPAAGVTVSGTAVTLTATATPPSGRTIASVQFKVDGINAGPVVSSGPFTTTLDSTTLTNAAHSLTAVVTDSSGVTATAVAVSFTVNNTAPPTVAVTSPSAGATVTGTTVTLTATATAASGRTVVSVQFKIDGTSLGSPLTTAPYGATLDSTTLTNGSHSLTAVATDSAGSTATSTSINFTVSNTAPTVTITAPTVGASITGTSVSLTATATAAQGRTITSVQFKVDGTNVGSADTSAPYATTLDSTTLTNGTHSVTAVVTDSTNAVATSTAVSVTVNNTASTVAVTAPAAGASVSGTTVTLTASASPGSGRTITSVQFKVDGANVASALTLAPYTTTFDSTTLTNGTHSITAVLTDSAGNTVSSAAISFTVANSLSTVTVTAPTSGASVSGNSVSLAATATPGSGRTITSVQFKVDGTNIGPALTAAPYSTTLDSTTLTNATHSLTAALTDSAGSTVPSATVSFTVANTTVAITAPAAGATVSGTSVTLAASPSPGSGRTIASVQFKVDGANIGAPVTAAPYTATLDSTTLTNASHSVTAVATDSGGTTGTSPAVSFTVNNPAAAPTASITAPAAGATVSGTAVTISATATAASGRTIASVQFKVDGANIGAPVTAAPYTVTLDSTTLTNASHSVTAVATDSGGTTGTSPAVSFTVNNPVAAPTAAITAPAAGATVSGTAVTVSATATAASGRTIASVQFKVDGANIGAPVTAAPYTTTLDSTTLTNASHSVTAVATDSGGSTGTSPAVSFTVNNPVAAPTASITAPAAGATVSGTAVAVSATATAASGRTIASVQFKVDGANIGVPVTAAPYAVTLDSTTLTNASHSVTAVATDSGGTTGTSPAVSFTVNNPVAAPTAAITAPAAGATLSGTAVTVSATATAASGRTIASVQFKVDGANIGAPVTAAPYAVTLDSTTLTNASHSVTAVATDSGGTTGTSPAVSFTVNNPVAAPTAAITAPAAGATVSGTAVTVSATATAASGRTIASVQFKVDGANIGSPVTAAPYTVTLDSTTLTNASHSVTAVATDSGGTTGTSPAVSFTVNNPVAAPTASITAPAAGATVSGNGGDPYRRRRQPPRGGQIASAAVQGRRSQHRGAGNGCSLHSDRWTARR